jgi:hypothetical protein
MEKRQTLMAGKSEFDASIGLAICSRIAGGESLRKICSDPDMPVQSTVFKWLSSNEAFSKQYAHARTVQMEAMAEEILEIADSADSENYNPSRLQVDTRKWLMSKLAPKKFGDKVEQFISGPEGGPIKASISVQFVKTNDSSQG